MSTWFGIIFIAVGSTLYRTFIDSNPGLIGSIVVGALSGALGGAIGTLIDHYLEKRKIHKSPEISPTIVDESENTKEEEGEVVTNAIGRSKSPIMNKYIYLLAISIIGLVAIFIYPTLYYYDKFDKFPVKINRVTGHSEMLTANGWVSMNGPENNFTNGSTMNDVKRVMGVPWYTYKFPNSEMWYYKVSGKSSSIEFKDGKVIGWKDDDKILKIK